MFDIGFTGYYIVNVLRSKNKKNPSMFPYDFHSIIKTVSGISGITTVLDFLEENYYYCVWLVMLPAITKLDERILEMFDRKISRQIFGTITNNEYDI